MPWPVPKDFDGAAFRKRYPQLGEWDYFIHGTMLHLREGITLPDDPPIMEVADPVQQARQRIVDFVESTEAPAKSARGLARVVHTSVSNVITKHNALVAILASGRFPTQQEAASLTIPIRDFATLMTNVKQMAINEANPNT